MGKVLIDPDWLKEQYCVRQLTTTEIAKITNCSKSTIKNRLKEFSIPVRQNQGPKRIEISKDKLEKLYLEKRKKIIEIATTFQCHEETIRRRLKEFSIPFRLGDRKKNKRRSLLRKKNKSLLEQIRLLHEYYHWRSLVYQRDNFTCQWCGAQNFLEADHIISLREIVEILQIKTIQEAQGCEDLWSIDNGRTLCEACHMKTDTWGKRNAKRKRSH